MRTTDEPGVSGRSKPATMGALKTGHFEEPQIWHLGLRGTAISFRSPIMSNLLEVAMIDIILSLYRKGWSQR